MRALSRSRRSRSAAFGGARFGFAPGFEMTLPTHTNGTRPVKMPVPPRICVLRSPTAFQLNPMRGENSSLAPGSLLWSTTSGLPFSSSAVSPREYGLSTGSVKYIGTSTRRPKVSVEPVGREQLVLRIERDLADRMFSPLYGPVPIIALNSIWFGPGVGCGEEFAERGERGCRCRNELRQEEDAVPEDVERVEELERLEIRAEGERVLAAEEAEVVGELPDILVEDVVDRERLVAGVV